MAQDPSKALAVSAAPEGALATTKPTAQFSLDKWPADQFNRLVPTQTVMTTDLLMPIVQIVQLDIEDDTYTSNDVPAGKRAPGARALNKFANAASVSFLDERRVDDGTVPELMRVTVTASMTLPTGQRITATGTKEVDLRRITMTPAQLGKFKGFFYEHVATRARNRAIRALLSLKSSYTLAELQKPFAVVTFVPNTNHPDVRRAMLAALSGNVESVFGPSAKAIGPGGDFEAPEAPDDDEVAEGQFVEQEPEPEWFKGATAVAAAPEITGHRLERMLRAEAAKLEADPEAKGPRTEEQASNLKALLAPLGFDVVVRVLGRVYGLKNLADITRAQASALFIVSDAEDHFADLWRELDAIAQAQR